MMHGALGLKVPWRVTLIHVERYVSQGKRRISEYLEGSFCLIGITINALLPNKIVNLGKS